MKILYANDFLVYSGAEALIKKIMGCARAAGHDTKLVAPYLNRQHAPSGKDVTATIKKWQPDLVHFHNIPAIGFSPLEYCVKHGVPAVWTVHDWYPVCRVRTRINAYRQICFPESWSQCDNCTRKAFPLLMNLAKLRDLGNHVEMVTISNAQKLLMSDFGYDVNHITVIKNGVDTKQLTQGKDEGYIFYFSLLRWEKAFDWHLKSAETLPYKHAMAGAPIDPHIKIDKTHLKTEYLGFVPTVLLHKFLRNASLVQMPIRWPEPCGLTILESFACGKPVVSVALGGVPEYVEDGKTGFLVEAGDVTGFIDLTHYLMEHEELRHQMGKNALEASRIHSLERVWKDYEEIYKKALK